MGGVWTERGVRDISGQEYANTRAPQMTRMHSLKPLSLPL